MNKQNEELAAQLAEEQRKVEELQFIREQENQDVTRIEVELMKINQVNSQLQLQVEESKRDLNDKTRKLTELDELIAVLKDQKEIFK